MLDFFIGPSKGEVNSISGMVNERLYIDTCASTRICVVTPYGQICFETVELLKQPIPLGLTDKASSMIVQRMGRTKYWQSPKASGT
jgi:hypothetical protein